MRVVATRKFFQQDIDFFKQSLPHVDFVFPDEASFEFLLEQCDLGVDVFLGPPPAKEILRKALPRLKLIQIPWAGVENILFDDARTLKIPCSNSHSNSIVVAEMGISLLFELLKKIALHDRGLRRGEWHRPDDVNGFYPPRKLSGSRIGFFGYGAINKAIHKMLSGFDITFTACVTKQRGIAGLSKVFGASELSSFLCAVDILFVAAPMTPDTNGIFDKSILSLLKNNAYIVNVSRANLFVEADLFELLKSGMIAGAALDVWWNNPGRGRSKCMPSSLPFNELENVVLSPHRSGFSLGELPHLDGAVENIDRISNRKAAKSLIDLSRGY
jgi:phosphoglycerate dehydrogenase-like enzyme